MKYRYQKQYVRDDYLLTKNPIFDLSRCRVLRTKKDMLAVFVDKGEEDKAVYHYNEITNMITSNDESLSNILGFQAGGPNVINPYRDFVSIYSGHKDESNPYLIKTNNNGCDASPDQLHTS
jgi:hypothetical protein